MVTNRPSLLIVRRAVSILKSGMSSCWHCDGRSFIIACAWIRVARYTCRPEGGETNQTAVLIITHFKCSTCALDLDSVNTTSTADVAPSRCQFW